jgi:TetR/AcrR family transcriptional regulator
VPRGAKDSRQALLHAAAAEFAARGFAGAGVDRIARRAGVNKAMIYYHFKGKADLYHEIVRDMFTAVRNRTGTVAASRLAPAEKIDGFIEAVVAEARLRRHLPPIMMREAAEGGRHLDPDTIRIMLGVFANLRAILADGEAARAFRCLDPIVMYFTIVGPIVMYLAFAPIRNAIGQLKSTRLAPSEAAVLSRHLTTYGDVDALGDHVKAAARRLLERQPARSRPGSTPTLRMTSRQHAAARSGEQA